MQQAIAEFQFLMVRLKGKYNRYKNNGTDISIPYGAIKSLKRYTLLALLGIFQFLMVRLKVIQKRGKK